MSTVALHVKHSGTVYDVTVETSAEGLTLKRKLEELTGVPVSRQKFLVKGRQLQDTTPLQSLGLKDGQSLLMLGSKPETAPAASQPVSESNLDAVALGAPASAQSDADATGAAGNNEAEETPVGLVNVGNTCYANATLEALRTVPELDTALQHYSGSDALLRSWKALTPQFGANPPSVADAPVPHAFLIQLRQRFPQFDEIGPDHMHKQQDAEELWTRLMWELNGADSPDLKEVGKSFEGRFAVRTEKPGGDVEDSSEDFTRLLCHITIRTNFLKDGIKASLRDEIDASADGSEADSQQFVVTKKIERLPKYLAVQFVRFFWRKDTKKNSKILRKVSFPMQLDIGDLSTPDLATKLAPAREAYRELESAIEESKRAKRRARFQKIDDSAQINKADEAAMERRRAAIQAEREDSEREKQRMDDLRRKFSEQSAAVTANDHTASSTGLYDLQAIITHQGTSADSGHYQCFTRNPNRENSWWRFNDDRVSEVDDARIAQLAGGGASDSALILLYKSTSV